MWYAIERFFTHLFWGLGFAAAITFLMALLGRKVSWLSLLKKRWFMVMAASVIVVILGGTFEAFDYMKDGAIKSASDWISWLAAAGIFPFGCYRFNKLWNESD